MPFDAIFLSATLGEIRTQAVGSRIDKVHQPSRDTVLLFLRARTGNCKLLITTGASHARIHFTEEVPENPAQPPMFCMLLRKHLIGAKIAEILQPEMERAVDIRLECTDDFGEPCEKHLIAELMGRNSNLILLDSEQRIIDCMRRVDYEMSEQRQVLPGLFYHLPPQQNKKNPQTADWESILQAMPDSGMHVHGDEWLLQTYSALPPLLCREIMFSLTGQTDPDCGTWTEAFRMTVAKKLEEILQTLTGGAVKPVLLLRDGRPFDFTYRDIRQYGNVMQSQYPESFSKLLDLFYAQRDSADRIRQKSQTLRKTVSSLRDRTARKMANQRKELAETLDRDRLRQYGDIITANLGRIQRGDRKLLAEDFYDPDMKSVEIPLSPTLSPQQNAAKYYKDYSKAKHAETYLKEELTKGEAELNYLNGILDDMSRAESERDLTEIRQELLSGGYLREKGGKKAMKVQPQKPRLFYSSDGFPILVGRNNRQNDELTLKTADRGDLWLHVQKMHGSHVILVCHGVTPPDETVTEAMILAAWYSQARNSQGVPVDYTPVRYIKKPGGSKPGFVVYTTYKTGYVTPTEEAVATLRSNGSVGKEK